MSSGKTDGIPAKKIKLPFMSAYVVHCWRLKIQIYGIVPDCQFEVKTICFTIFMSTHNPSKRPLTPKTNENLDAVARFTVNALVQIEARRNMPFQRVRFRILICPLFILLAIGCKDSTSSPGSAAAPASAEIASDPSGVTIALDASPREVAQVALQAIEAGNKDALRSLVAVKKVTQDIEAITRDRAAFQGMVANAIPTAVSAIMLEINGLDVEGREIDQESITDDTAMVTVKGMRAGQAQTRRFFLVKEDSQWRLVPSHR